MISKEQRSAFNRADVEENENNGRESQVELELPGPQDNICNSCKTTLHLRWFPFFGYRRF